MPIHIPNGLPAEAILRQEGIPTISEQQAVHQDIRPLSIALLNLMPHKQVTETQFLRLLGQSPLQIKISLLSMDRVSKNTSLQHMQTFYHSWQRIKQQRFDGLIITGAPVELLEYSEVSYWPQLAAVFDWCRDHCTRILLVCWGAQAALHHYYGINKVLLPQKAFGIYRQQVVTENAYLVRGVNDRFYVPVSRHTSITTEDIARQGTDLILRITCPFTGPSLLQSRDSRFTYIFNHFEYDGDTLANEYQRDCKQGKRQLPVNYFPDDDDTRKPINRWRASAHLIYRNWLDDIYQATPYDETQIGNVMTNQHLQLNA